MIGINKVPPTIPLSAPQGKKLRACGLSFVMQLDVINANAIIFYTIKGIAACT